MKTLVAALLGLGLAASGISPQELEQLLLTVGNGSQPQVEQVINRLQFLGTPRPATQALAKMALGEIPGSQENAIYVLSVLHPPEAAPAFAQLLTAEGAPLRLASCRGLTKLKPSASVAKSVGERLSDKVPAVRRQCAQTLAAWDGAGQGPALARALTSEKDPDARLAEIDALGHAKGPAPVKALEPALKSPSHEERLAAAKSLAMLGAPSGKKALEDELSALDPSVRGQAVDAAAQVGAPWATDALAKRLDDPSASVCIKAAKALHARKDPRGVSALILRAERASPDDKFAFEGALSELKVTQAQRLDVLQKSGAAH